MKKRCFSIFVAALLLLTACGQSAPAQEKGAKLTVVCTTYPIYLFASAVTEGVDGVEVVRLDTGSTSCLHDYNLTVNDMKKIERADVLALNGAGLEEFMEDALSTSDALVIDCSVGVELLENEGHHHEEEEGDDGDDHEGHDHGHFDPHYWMDPDNAAVIVENLSAALCELDEANSMTYFHNMQSAVLTLTSLSAQLEDAFRAEWADSLEIPGLITFHDGFQYFAHAYDLPLLESIEEEAGSEASAKEIVEITRLVNEYDIPVIFTEVNGSDATAKAIVRETGCSIAQLSMVMDGPDDDLSNYVYAMMENMAAVINGFAEEEVVTLP